MTVFEDITKGFREKSNRPIRDNFAMTTDVRAEYDAIQNSWRVEEEKGVPVVREPYIEKIPQGKGFREKRRYSMKEEDYAKQLTLLQDSAESYMADYPELFGAELTQRSIHSVTKDRFPDLDINNPAEVERHRMHVKMYYQQEYLNKRNMIIEKISAVQTRKREKGMTPDLTDISASHLNPAQKAYYILHSVKGQVAPNFHHTIQIAS